MLNLNGCLSLFAVLIVFIGKGSPNAFAKVDRR